MKPHDTHEHLPPQHEDAHHAGDLYGKAYEHEIKREFGPDHPHLRPVVPHHKDERLKIPSEPAKEHHAVAAQKEAAKEAEKQELARKTKE